MWEQFMRFPELIICMLYMFFLSFVLSVRGGFWDYFMLKFVPFILGCSLLIRFSYLVGWVH